ncbi:MAG TPA: hypothetical protein VLE99_04480 [Candidatus Saccharimonadales bacterium]|nr:hypothetical protein [Candidatus Saccharimonadales bacterium]
MDGFTSDWGKHGSRTGDPDESTQAGTGLGGQVRLDRPGRDRRLGHRQRRGATGAMRVVMAARV